MRTIFERSVIFGVLFASATAGMLSGQTWVRVASGNPPARFVPAMSGLPGGAGILLYGGARTLTNPLADTWSFDGTRWTQLRPSLSPPALQASEMVCDTGRGRVVLFGGLTTNFRSSDATYEWLGSFWRVRNVQPRPPARAFHGMAYDPVRKVTVVFGGADFSFGIRRLGDTWEWDGKVWRQIRPPSSPSARSDFAMAYSPALRRVVLHGGNRGGGNYLDDTWLFDGTSWQRFDPPAPGPVVTAGAMATHEATGGVILFGGARPPSGASQDTWLLHPRRGWVRFHTHSAPSLRTDHGVAHVPGKGFFVYGGGQANRSAVDDTWWFTGDDAAFMTLGVGCGRAGEIPQLVPVAGSTPRLGTSLYVNLRGFARSVASGWMLTSPSTQDVVMSLRSIGLPMCRGYTRLDAALSMQPLSVVGGQAQWAVAVPGDPNLIGLEFSLQGVGLDSGSPLPLPLVLSRGGIARCGT